MSLSGILDSVAKKMDVDFAELTAQVVHAPSKGRTREGIVAEFARAYLPKTGVVVQNAEIIATDGSVSRECDIVIADSTTPPLLALDGYSVLPIECVHAVIEVKRKLDSGELEDAFNKIVRVKEMRKGAYFPQEGAIVRGTTAYGREWDFFPTHGFVFAFEGIDLTTLRKRLDELNGTRPLWQRVDAVWVLRRGALMNWSDATTSVAANPGPGTRLRAFRSDNPLFLAATSLQAALAHAWMPRFRLTDYLDPAVVIASPLEP